MNRLILSAILILNFTFTAIGQNTVGLLSFDFSQQFDGYNLMYPHNQPSVFLLNNCGEIVHTWEDDADFRPGNVAELMPNGDLVKAKRPSAVTGNPIWAGGGGAIVEIRTWDNDLLWTFERNDSLDRLHHDIAVMPNGNILMIVWELKTAEEAIQAGRDSSLLSQGKLWPDYIIEVEPIGEDSFNIAWEWHVWDHLVQDYDSEKDNFGVVADNPGLVDINFQTNDGKADWLHTNSIDYNEELDQIIISTPFLSEVWMIDHTTTTEEAAGHTGGFYGMGGDLIYRWGNNQVFDQGTAEDQQLFGQHDAHWIDAYLSGSQPQVGKIAVFNNNLGDGTYSAAQIFEPVYLMYDQEYEKDGSVFAPANFDWTYVHPDTVPMQSSGLSGMQILPNGNTLIGVGRRGYAFEINLDEEIVWEYRTPLAGGIPATQGDTLNINQNLTFRFNRIPMDYAAFDGRDLSPKGFIELEPDTEFCDMTSSSEDLEKNTTTYIYPNPASQDLTIEWMSGGKGLIDVFDV
ncbi:MAG: hypothetical protein DRI69_07575, partial [Bacteroidetes bacterium]